MWWHDLRLRLCAALFGALLAGVAGCTVQPLYGGGSSGPVASRLASIAISPVGTRPAQEVRNHLIFLFGGGAGQPENPAYLLDLDIDSRVSETALVQIGSENEPSAGTVIMTGIWRLRDATSGEVIASGTRRANASFDRTRQEFANVRAIRDAENRAARELAEMLRLAVAEK